MHCSQFDVTPDSIPVSIIIFVLFVISWKLIIWNSNVVEETESDICNKKHENEK